MAVSRAPFIDQSQSLNIHLPDPNFSKMTSMHFYAWRSGLKTGMYYLRSRPAVDAIKFTVNVEELLKATDGNDTDSILKVLGKPVDDTENKENSNPNSTPKTINLSTNTTLDLKSLKSYEEPEACINCSG